MTTHSFFAHPRGGRIAAAVLILLALALGGRPALAQDQTPGPLFGTDVLNDALFIERLAADFFTLNANKPFLSTTPVSTPPADPTTPDGGAGTAQEPAELTADLTALRALVRELREHHTANAALLQQRLGANAAPPPAFQRTRLDAPSLSQFLETALLIEEAAVHTLQGAIFTARQALPDDTTPTTPVGLDEVTLLITLGMTDAMHLGALRAWRLRAGTALGGDPNTLLTAGTMVETRTLDQLNALLQPFLAEPVAPPPTDGGTPAPPPDDGTPAPPGTTPIGLAVASVTVSPASISQVQAVTISVTLTGVAPAGGSRVTLTSSNQPLLAIPQDLLVPEGQQGASLQVRPTPGIFGTVTITARIGSGRAASATLTVTAQ